MSRPELGRLGPALAWLAEAQGGWPPRRPEQVRRLAVTSGVGLAAGVAEADALADAAVDLLVLEAPGDSTAALVVLCALLDLEPVEAVGTSRDPGWATRLVAVRDGLVPARGVVGDPAALVADPVVGRLTGLLVQSARRRTPVVLDGSPVAAAAALAAERLSPGARRWWLVGCTGGSAAAQQALAELALEPLIDLRLTVPGGAGLAADLLLSAVELVP